MTPQWKLTILTTIVCILFGLWKESIWAGLFFAFLDLLILTWVNTTLEILYDDPHTQDTNNNK